MFAKLVVVILTIGACACTLLSMRQARLQAAHELARAQLRVRACDERLWALRADIGRRVMPDQVRQMADALGNFRPMLPLPSDLMRQPFYAVASADAWKELDEQPEPADEPTPAVQIRTASLPTTQAPLPRPGSTPAQTPTRASSKSAAASGVNTASKAPAAKPKSPAKPDAKPAGRPGPPPKSSPARHASATPRESR